MKQRAGSVATISVQSQTVRDAVEKQSRVATTRIRRQEAASGLRGRYRGTQASPFIVESEPPIDSAGDLEPRADNCERMRPLYAP